MANAGADRVGEAEASVNPYASPQSSEQPREAGSDRDERKLRARIRWAQGVLVLTALLALSTLPQYPWRSAAGAAFSLAALLLSVRTPLWGLLLGFAISLPKWCAAIAVVLIPEKSRELLSARLSGELAHALVAALALAGISTLAFAVIMWRGIEAATKLHGREPEAWPLLRPPLALTVVMAASTSVAFVADGRLTYYANTIELAGVVAAFPVVWRALDEWRGALAWRRVKPQHVLLALGGFLGLAAFHQEYFWLADAIGVKVIDPLGWQLTEEWSAELLLLFFIVVVPVLDELVFRGFVQVRLERVMPPVAALGAQAALFAAAHSVAGVWICHAVVGLALGWLRRRTRTLYVPIAVHASYNAWLVLSDLGHLPEALMFR